MWNWFLLKRRQRMGGKTILPLCLTDVESGERLISASTHLHPIIFSNFIHLIKRLLSWDMMTTDTSYYSVRRKNNEGHWLWRLLDISPALLVIMIITSPECWNRFDWESSSISHCPVGVTVSSSSEIAVWPPEVGPWRQGGKKRASVLDDLNKRRK